MPIQAMNQTLNARLVDVSDVRCRLTWFLAENNGMGVDQAESVDDDFAFDRLDGIDDYSYRTGVQAFEGL